MAFPLSASNFMGRFVFASTTHPIRYPLGHGAEIAGFFVSVLESSGLNETLLLRRAIMSKPASLQMPFEAISSFPGQTQWNLIFTGSLSAHVVPLGHWTRISISVVGVLTLSSVCVPLTNL